MVDNQLDKNIKDPDSPKLFQFNFQGTNDGSDEDDLIECQDLQELTLNLKNHLISLKSIKKNFSKKFESIKLNSSGKKNSNDINYEQKYNEMVNKYEELEIVHNQTVYETLKENQNLKISYEDRLAIMEQEINNKNKTIDELNKEKQTSSEIISQLQSKINKLELANATMINQLKEQTDEMVSSLSGLEKKMLPKQNEIIDFKADLAKVLERISYLENILKNLKQNKIKDEEKIANLNTAFENLKSENFTLTLNNQNLMNKVAELEEKLKIEQNMQAKKCTSDTFLKNLMSYDQFFKKFTLDAKVSNDNFMALEQANNQLLAEKEKLLAENTKLKLEISNMMLQSTHNQQHQQQDDQIENQEIKIIHELDDKYYQETFDMLQKFEKELEKHNTEKNKLLDEKNELKKKVKELEEYINNMNLKVNEEKERLEREREREKERDKDKAKDNKGNIKKKATKKDYMEDDEEDEPKQRNNNNNVNTNTNTNSNTNANLNKLRSDEKNLTHSTVKDMLVSKLENTGIKKVVKNIPNPGPNPLSTVIICGICLMTIGKKEQKSCTNCPAVIHTKCLQDRNDERNRVLCNSCFEKSKKMENDSS